GHESLTLLDFAVHRDSPHVRVTQISAARLSSTEGLNYASAALYSRNGAVQGWVRLGSGRRERSSLAVPRSASGSWAWGSEALLDTERRRDRAGVPGHDGAGRRRGRRRPLAVEGRFAARRGAGGNPATRVHYEI